MYILSTPKWIKPLLPSEFLLAPIDKQTQQFGRVLLIIDIIVILLYIDLIKSQFIIESDGSDIVFYDM